MFNLSGVKVTGSFSVVRNLAVTTRIAINYSRADSFLQVNFFQLVRLNLTIRLSEVLPRYGKTQINSLLGTMKLSSLWINSLFKNF